MKQIALAALAGNLLAVATLAQSSVTLTIANAPGSVVPADYCGLSFGAIAEISDHGGVKGHLFSAKNTQLVTLFRNSGLRHLRLGGSTVEGTSAAVPDHAAIDSVFTFAQAADVKIMYSLRLLNGNPATAAADASYIWEHHRAQLDCFAIGNEPDISHYHYPPFGKGTDPAITNYTSYLADWRKFAAAVTNAVPGAHFAGPDAANHSFARRLAEDEKSSGIVSMITQHFYVGGRPYITKDGPEKIPASEAISNMLSAEWAEKKYPAIYEQAIAPVVAQGLPYRMTESDDYLKGVDGASDAFASALWALDYLHWWAAHGCSGVNFHNTEWLKTDTVYPDPSGNFQIHPKAYATRAFALGGIGCEEPVKIQNPQHVNLTAYAVADSSNLYVTIINKEYGADAHATAVSISTDGFSSGHAEEILLQAPAGDVGATNGITLGGAPITNDSPWSGKWTALESFSKGRLQVHVPSATAVVVRIAAH